MKNLTETIMAKTINKRALRRSILTSIGRLISIMLGAAAGTMLREFIGHKLDQLGLCILMFSISLILLIFFEYERELE